MFDPSDDLTVSDGLETVTLLRRGSTSGIAGTVIAHALRRAISAAEAAIVTTGDVHKNVPSGGQYAAAAVVWHLPVAELPIAPRLGDVILDGQSQRWTILEVKRTTLGSPLALRDQERRRRLWTGRHDFRAEGRPRRR